MLLNELELKELDKRIKDFEYKTKGEIRLALLKSSDPYPGANYRLAFFFSFIITLMVEIIFPLSGEQALSLVLSLLLVFFFTASFFPFRRLFIFPLEKEREVKEKATNLFFIHGLANTKNRIGILLLVSKLEKKIELLVDQTILQKLGQSTLDQNVKKISTFFKQEKYAEGLSEALLHLEKEILLAFPNGLQEKNQDEVSNKIILE